MTRKTANPERNIRHYFFFFSLEIFNDKTIIEIFMLWAKNDDMSKSDIDFLKLLFLFFHP